MPSISCFDSKCRKAFIRPLVENPSPLFFKLFGINKPCGFIYFRHETEFIYSRHGLSIYPDTKDFLNSDWVELKVDRVRVKDAL
jgi:hypothetical protein